MGDFPKGWSQIPLLEVVQLHDSQRVPLNQKERAQRTGPYPYFGANGKVDSIDEYIFDGDYILLAEDGGYFDDRKRGVAYEVSGKFWVNNHAHVLSPTNAISRRYLTYALNQLDWMPYVGGSTRLKLTQEGMKRICIPVAPLEQQCRIATKLDQLLGRTNAAAEELAKIPRLVERFKQAVLRTAFGEAETTASEVTTLGRLAQEVRNGASRKPDNAPPGVPILKISAVRAMTVRMNERRYYNPEGSEDVSRYALQSGDLLFTRYNGNPDLVANCGMVRELEERLIYPDKLIRVRIDRQLADPAFIEAICASPQARSVLAPFIKSAAGQHGISGTDLKELSLPLPPMKRQRQMIDRIQHAFAAIDALASESARAASLLDRLNQATLTKAFQGELVR